MKIVYARIPLKDVPFGKIVSLEDFNLDTIDCCYFPLKDFNGTDKCLVSVFPPGVGADYENSCLLFGRVISEIPQKRGPLKVTVIGGTERHITPESLPHLKYSNTNAPTGNWFYTTEGKYFIFSTVKADYERVKHLEGIAIYADNVLRLRIVVELLKKNIKKGLITLDFNEFERIAFDVLRSDPLTKNLPDAIIRDGVANWLPSMLSTPLFEDIGPQYRERVKTQ